MKTPTSRRGCRVLPGLLALLVAVALPAWAHASTKVWQVGAPGSTLSLLDTCLMAADGDVILVYPDAGANADVLYVLGKSLTVIGNPEDAGNPDTLVTVPVLQVRDLLPGQQAFVMGFVGAGGAKLFDNEGVAWLHTVRRSSKVALVVEESDAVMISKCGFFGAYQQPLTGAELTNSRVHMYASQIAGGYDNVLAPDGSGPVGGTAIVQHGGRTDMNGCLIQAGSAFIPSTFNKKCSAGWAADLTTPATLLFSYNSTAEHTQSNCHLCYSAFGPPPGCGVLTFAPTIGGPGIADGLDGPARTLKVPLVLETSDAYTATLSGAAGELFLLAAGTQLAPTDSWTYYNTWALGAGFQSILFGALPPSGTLELSGVVPPSILGSTGDEALTLVFQAMVQTSAGDLVMTDPTWTTILVPQVPPS